jgi:hypothetical protein
MKIPELAYDLIGSSKLPDTSDLLVGFSGSRLFHLRSDVGRPDAELP